MQYPHLPTIAFISAFLVLLPLPSHWRARNIATLALIFWLFFADIIYGVNSIVWAGNVLDHAPVWCDISTKFITGVSFALPLCTLCICKHLEMISSSRKFSYNTSDRKRRMIFEAVACFLVPLVFMILHYIVQEHRYDIIENIGCQATIYVSLPAVFIIWFPQLLFALITFIYGALALHNFVRHRLTFSAHLHNIHNNNNHPLTPNRYLRLISMALTEMLWGTILTSYNLYNIVTLAGLRPYTSWAQVHSHFDRVHFIPMTFLPKKGVAVMMLFWWGIPASSIIFFAFFGFGAEAVKEYKRLWSWLKAIVFRRPSGALEKKNTFRGLSSSCRPPLKLITLKWPRSTSPSSSEAKSPTSMISQSTITITPGQTLDSSLEPSTWKRSRSLEIVSEPQGFPIPTYYESTITTKGLGGNCSPTSSTHPTLIGQLIDPKRNERNQTHHLDAFLALPEIDESDAFTIDSFTYYERSAVPCASSPPLASALQPLRPSFSTPSTTRKSLTLSTTPPTPPHPPSPKFAFPQHSLPPPPARKQPRAIGSLSSLLRLSSSADEVDERGRFSRGDFSFHHPNTSSQQQHAHTRSPLQFETYSGTSSLPAHPVSELIQDVPEDVEPSSYIQSLGVLDSLPEREEFASGYVPLRRKRTLLGIEGGVVNVVVERSSSVDEGSMV